MSKQFNPLVKKGFDESGLSRADTDALYQPKENQRLSTSNSPTFAAIGTLAINLSKDSFTRRTTIATTTTSNSTPVNIATIPVNGTTLIEATITGLCPGSTPSAGFILKGTYNTTSGAVMSVTKENWSSSASFDANMTYSNGQVYISVTGLASETTWGANINYQWTIAEVPA